MPGLTVTLEVSLLENVRKTPLLPAGLANCIGRGANWPGPNTRLDGIRICDATTLMAELADSNREADAMTAALPAPIGVTAMVVVVAPWGTVTLAGTITTLGFVFKRFIS